MLVRDTVDDTLGDAIGRAEKFSFALSLLLLGRCKSGC